MTNSTQTLTLHEINERQRLQMAALERENLELKTSLAALKQVLILAEAIINEVERCRQQGYLDIIESDLIGRMIHAYNEA